MHLSVGQRGATPATRNRRHSNEWQKETSSTDGAAFVVPQTEDPAMTCVNSELGALRFDRLVMSEDAT